MAVNKRLLQGAAAAGGLVPSEHFGVVLYEGDGSTSHSINGGKFGAAFYGNGSNSKITFDTNFSQQTSFTISFWFNSSQYNDDHTIFQFEGDSNENSNRIGLFASGTEFGFYPHNTSGGAGRTSISTSDSSALYNGNWHHVALVIDGTSNSDATMYIDGSSKTLTTYESYTTTMRMTGDMRIGGRKDDSAGEFMEGKLDQLRVFQKALTSSEVSTLYAETASTVESLDPLSEDTTDTLQVLGDSSCIATYRFENNEDDESGNYDGTGTEIQYAAGRYGQAASFNGSTSNVDIGSFGSVFQQNFTVSLWFNLNSLSAFNNLFSAQDDYYVYMMARNDISKVRTSIEVAPSTAYVIDSGTISTNTWYHAVITVSSTDGFKFYMNNELQGTQAAATGNLRTMSGKSFIGAYQAADPGTFQYPTDGKIDQVRIFNKALSASEVTTLYNENSLVASYRFEGNANDDTRNYDGTASNVTYEYGLNFTPDFVWLKERSAAESHRLFDTTRGATKRLFSDNTNAESTASDSLTSFDTGGFTVGSSAAVNQDGQDYVGWAWKANGGTTSSNTDGDITSTVQANTAAGFSIITYTGNGGSAQTVGHGLGIAPKIIIIKERAGTGSWDDWVVGGDDISNWTKYLRLNQTAASATGYQTAPFSNTAPTSSVFTVTYQAGAGINGNGDTFVAYAFAEVDGFSKFGSYTGNGSDNGPIVETGFEPAFVMIKKVTDDGLGLGPWQIHDNKRDLTNPRKKYLLANSGNAEAEDLNGIDFLSNGFQIKDDYKHYNSNGTTFLYMAFAADPDTEEPTVAKSFSTVAYTGDGTTSNSIDGLGFKPGLIWLKDRDNGSYYHTLTDIIRYNSDDSTIFSNATNAANSDKYVTEINDDGFVVSTGPGPGVNTSGNDIIAWAWKADDNEPTLFGGPAKAVYKFEDNGNDVTGGLNLTESNMSYSSSGKFNKAAEFNGNNSSFTNGSITGLPTGTSPVSISYWVYTSTSNQDAGLVGYGRWNTGGTNSGAANKYFGTMLSGGDLFFAGYYYNTAFSPAVTLPTGQWNHLVWTFDGTNVRVYLNGSLAGTVDRSSLDIGGGSGNLSITIGRNSWSGTGSEHFDGKIDQVRIYSGKLEDYQVTELYNETASDNDDLILGGPPETIISANANAGFSIVKYTNDNPGSAARIPHGLSSTPEMIIVKRIDGVEDWYVYHTSMGLNKYMRLNLTDAQGTATNLFNTVNATVFNPSFTSSAGQECIAYCFHSVSGYSKIGSYSGGSTGSGNVITTGFQPDWIMIKRTDTADDWTIMDSVRGDGASSRRLIANTSEVEKSATSIWYPTSTGFYFESTGNSINASGGTYIYMAFKIN